MISSLFDWSLSFPHFLLFLFSSYTTKQEFVFKCVKYTLQLSYLNTQ